MTDLTGRVALVTGGSRGIGRAVALALAAAGCDVAVNYRKAADEAEAVSAAIGKLGRRAVALQADVAEAGEVERLVMVAEQALGPIDILINNAGIARRQPLDEITLSDWEEILRVNLTSSFLVTQAVLPGMRQRRWGRIVMISSVAAQLGGVIGPHYAASKAGQIGLMHSYATILAKEGITANAIAPALIETEMVTGNPAAQPDRIPVGRFGRTEEVAEIAVMLARNGYVTGQTINANGGWYMS
ncbi:MAG: 3-oxoacyl-ACP reductase family protein [Dongiaceae bacterium]